MRQYLRASGGPTGAYALVPSTNSSSGGSSSGGGSSENLPPHIFAVAQAALANLHCPDIITSSSSSTSNDRKSSIVEAKDQVLVICGESGAGKTETTKLVMQYLAFASTQAAKGKLNSGKSVRASFNYAFTVLFARLNHAFDTRVLQNTVLIRNFAIRAPMQPRFVVFCAAFRYLLVFLHLPRSLLLCLILDCMSQALLFFLLRWPTASSSRALCSKRLEMRKRDATTTPADSVNLPPSSTASTAVAVTVAVIVVEIVAVAIAFPMAKMVLVATEAAFAARIVPTCFWKQAE